MLKKDIIFLNHILVCLFVYHLVRGREGDIMEP